MILLEQMESVNPSERIVLAYDAWCKLMNDVEALEHVARAAGDAWPFIFDDIPTALNTKRKKYKKLGDAIEEAGHLLR